MNSSSFSVQEILNEVDSSIKVKKSLENIRNRLYNVYTIAETALKAPPIPSISILQGGVNYRVYGWNFCAVFATKLASPRI